MTPEALRNYASQTSDIERFILYSQQTSVRSKLFRRVQSLHIEAVILRSFLRTEFILKDMEDLRGEIENGTISPGNAFQSVHDLQSRLNILAIDFARFSKALQPNPASGDAFEESTERLKNIVQIQIHPEIKVLKAQVEFPAFAGDWKIKKSYAKMVRWMMEQSHQPSDAFITRAGSENTISIHDSRTVQRVAAQILIQESALIPTSNILEIGYGSIPILSYLHQKIAPEGATFGVDLHTVPEDFAAPNSPVRLFESKTPTAPTLTKELKIKGRFQLIYGVDVFKDYSKFGVPLQIANKTKYLRWIRSLLSDEGYFVIINDDFRRPHVFSDEQLEAAGLTTLKTQSVRYKNQRQLTYWVIGSKVSPEARKP